MASPIRTLTVNFVGRTDSLDKAFKRVSKGSSLMSDRMRRSAMIGMGAFAGIGAAVVAATAVLKPMIDKAASMEEAISKNQLMFGDASKAVERFAEASLHGYGVAERAALQATGVFGSLGRAMGMADADSADMAITLTKLAGGLSSLHDVDVETALTALRAGLIGEAEPLRKLGILLDAATIKTKALEMGLVDSTKDALTPAIKSQAAYALILEKGADAMDDFGRTKDSATNQTKILAGELDKISTQIGTTLLPAYTSIVTFMNEELLPAFKDFVDDPSVKNFGEFVGDAIGAVFPGAREAIRADQITPLDIFGAAIDYQLAGVRVLRDFVSGVETGLEAADIRARLQAIFDDILPPFDLEAVLAQETPLGGEFVVEGWQPDVVAAPSWADSFEDAMAEVVADLFDDDADPFAGQRPFGFAGAVAPAPAPSPFQDVAVDPFAGFEDIVADFEDVVADFEAVVAGFEDVVVDPFGGVGGSIDLEDVVVDPFGGFDEPAAGPSDAEILKWLEGADAQKFLGFGMDPGQRAGDINVTIVSSAVTGTEVIDAMAAAIRESGPFSREWVQ